MRRRLLVAGWLLALALSASLPLSALFRGVLHIGPGVLQVSGRSTKPVVAIGSDVVLSSGSRSVVLVIGGSIDASHTISDDLVALGGRVYLRPNSRIHGDVLTVIGGIYRSPGVRADGRLGGALHYWDGKSAPAYQDTRGLIFTNIRLGLAAGLALLLVGTCLTVVFPWQVVLIATTLRVSPVKSVGAGILNLLIFVFLVVPLGLSLVGLPFALLLTGAASLAWLFGLTAAAVLLGRLISPHTVPLLWAAAGGLVVIAVSLAIPVLGPIAISVLGLTGAGALAVALLNRARPSVPMT